MPVFMLSTWQWVILTFVIPTVVQSGGHGAGVPATETSIEGSAVDLFATHGRQSCCDVLLSLPAMFVLSGSRCGQLETDHFAFVVDFV
ncbi:hypothetical protein TNCT_727101 [Trichonephila clavata]|uniref:Secreted protein n=1 Tax=Trichonephila clavata TaxID=2740835 RepID=A0A8X6F303_TRICU|nr:hypothetical protein TNCT_727101 [Trichonephila clavata]